MAITVGNSAVLQIPMESLLISSDLQHCYAQAAVVQIVIVPSDSIPPISPLTMWATKYLSWLMPWEIRWFMVNVYPPVVKHGVLENPLFVDFPSYKPPFAGEYM